MHPFFQKSLKLFLIKMSTIPATYHFRTFALSQLFYHALQFVIVIMLPCISELRTFVQYYHKFCASEYDRIIAISITDS